MPEKSLVSIVGRKGGSPKSRAKKRRAKMVAHRAERRMRLKLARESKVRH